MELGLALGVPCHLNHYPNACPSVVFSGVLLNFFYERQQKSGRKMIDDAVFHSCQVNVYRSTPVCKMSPGHKGLGRRNRVPGLCCAPARVPSLFIAKGEVLQTREGGTHLPREVCC